MPTCEQKYTAIVPAAGVGKRMNADRPKQYLTILGKTVLEHTLQTLISHPRVDHIVVALDPHDPYFDALPCSKADWLTRVNGGQERADSVLAGLNVKTANTWVLVHDAARPCLQHIDIDRLVAIADTPESENCCGGILACAAKDTMKRAHSKQTHVIDTTVDRDNLWHALTPQFFKREPLLDALSRALVNQANITDEASAMEWAGHQVALVEGSATNIKITRPEDLPLAEFYLSTESI